MGSIKPPAFFITEAGNGGYIVYDEVFNEPYGDTRYTSKSAAARAVLTDAPAAKIVGLDRSILTRIRRELGQMFDFGYGRAIEVDGVEYEYAEQVTLAGTRHLVFEIWRRIDGGRACDGRLYVPGQVPPSGSMGSARLARLIRQELEQRTARLDRERRRNAHLFDPNRFPA